jgi:glyoxylase-like metal-dependent hydrolase (beta-lactamase superfamily II)
MVGRELAPDVVAMMSADVEAVDHTATNAGFVIGTRAVLVVETLSNGRLAAQLLAEIRKRTDLPIRYAVNTSHHGDHCFGNFLLPAETVVIGHPATRRLLASDFEGERAGMLATLGAGHGIEDVVPRLPDLTVHDRLNIDLGGIAVEVRHIGFIQTDGDLAVAVPSRNVVFVGNALQAPPPAVAWVPDGRVAETLESYRRLHDWLNDETVIVSGHGRLMRRADIRYSIDYLESARDAVADCVRAGLDLELTRPAAPPPREKAYIH